MTADVLDRLSRRSTVVGECWLWDGCLNSRGYGCIGINGVSRLAHRVAYEAAKGPIPDGLVIDHLCHNADPSCSGGPTCRHRRCWRPEHLDATTPRLNQSRSHRDGSHRTHCPQGHPYTDANTRLRDGKRSCRKCGAESAAKSAAKTLAASDGHPPTWTPGSAYGRGCRCTECRATNADIQRRHQERRRAALIAEAVPPTPSERAS